MHKCYFLCHYVLVLLLSQVSYLSSISSCHSASVLSLAILVATFLTVVTPFPHAWYCLMAV